MTFDEYRELLRELKNAVELHAVNRSGFFYDLPKELSKKYLDMMYEEVLEEFKEKMSHGLDIFADLPNKRR